MTTGIKKKKAFYALQWKFPWKPDIRTSLSINVGKQVTWLDTCLKCFFSLQRHRRRSWTWKNWPKEAVTPVSTLMQTCLLWFSKNILVKTLLHRVNKKHVCTFIQQMAKTGHGFCLLAGLSCTCFRVETRHWKKKRKPRASAVLATACVWGNVSKAALLEIISFANNLGKSSFCFWSKNLENQNWQKATSVETGHRWRAGWLVPHGAQKQALPIWLCSDDHIRERGNMKLSCSKMTTAASSSLLTACQ